MTMAVTSPAPAPAPAPAPQGHCSQCGKVWTLNERQGICQWCGKLTVSQANGAKPRHIKSRSNGRQKQPNGNGNGNGYHQLEGEWLTYYKVASRFAHKAKVEDTEDLLHDIILTLAVAERNNGHKPFTEAAMYRIASRAQADYWRAYYKLTTGLDCRHCSTTQRRKCKEDWSYGECPKAIKLESLNKPILDGEGNLTELGELIADDKAMELDAWVSDSTWEIGYKPRLVAIAYKLKGGYPLTNADMIYLCKWRKKEQKRLI